MNTFHSSLYAVALLGCLLLAFIAYVGPRPRARWLVALLTLQSLSFACEWLMSNPVSPAKALWLALVMAVALLLAPCLWLYARTLAEGTPPRLRDLPRAHLLPIVIGFTLLVPLTQSAHLGTGFMPGGEAADDWLTQIIHETMIAAVALFAVQALYYLRASHAILRRQSRLARALLSDIPDRESNTLRLMLVVVGAHWVVGIARTLHCLMLGKDAGFIVLFAVAEIMFTLWALFALATAARTLPADEQPLAEELESEPEEARYARSALDAPIRARILRKLDEAWDARKLHRDGRLSLRLLCVELRENPHYVSQVINQDVGTSFYDLVNRRRIRDAMDQLARTSRPVWEIALEVGFNSKSTFNAAFRQHAGTTPTEFRRRAQAASAAPSAQSGPTGQDA